MAKKNYRKRKSNQSKKKEEVVETQNIWHIITISGCIILFFCFFYFVTLYLTRESRESNSSTNTETSSTDITNETLVGRSLDMSDGEYYVLFYDTTDEDISSVYKDILNNYNAKSDPVSIYTVDMGNILNKGYASDSSNSSPSTAEEIKINGPTLMKVNNHQVELYIEGEEGIRNSLN